MPSILLALSLSLFATLVVAQGQLPCHADKGSLGAWECQHVTLPASLCKACPLRETSATGDFFKCNDIYNLDAVGCKAQLQQYVNLNPCDGKRKEQVASWSDWDKQKLDYFVYSVCEECCDCIPGGTQEGAYETLLKTHTDAMPTLYKAERGNCPAHAYYDICTVLPNVKFMKLPNGTSHWDWPKMCTLLQGWFNSPASTNWWSGDTWISAELKRALNNVNMVTQCKEESTWKACRFLEAKQNRI